MHIRDRDQFEEKCRRLREDGPDKLHIVSDFDKTLTKQYIHNHTQFSSFVLLREQGDVSEEYVRQAVELFHTYHPIERDPNVSHDVKYQHMVEWWHKQYGLLCKEGMSRKMLQRVGRSSTQCFRDGINRFLSSLYTHNIPVLIFSAGLGDVITELLRHNSLYTHNVHVIANFFDFDYNDRAVSVKNDLIHLFNKGEHALDGQYQDAVRDRDNVILLGDSEGDVTMADGMEHSTVLRIGFLNDRVEERMPRFEQIYDAVITDDGPLTEVNEIIASIIR